jgi:hypothetical protein
MKRILLAVVVLLVASTASAQNLEPAPKPHGLTAAAVSYALAANLDSLSTYQGQIDGTIREANPMYAHMTPAASLVVGEAVDAATIALALHVGRAHPKIATVALWTLTGLRLYATARTVQTLSGRR